MDDFARGLAEDMVKVTAAWRRQVEREIREASLRARRRDAFIRSRRLTIQQAAWEVMEPAYLKASAGGTLPASPRQVMYAARGAIQDRTGRKLDDRYFTQTLLPDYIARTGVSWDIVWDARGGLEEPHTGHRVPLGTLQVREYLGLRQNRCQPAARKVGGGSWHTAGPCDRYGAALFVEKEGFLPLFRAVRLAERYDLAILSSKGVSTTAARTLIDRLVADQVPVLCIRDFDEAGFKIAGTLGRDTRRYAWRSEGAVDLGLRLADVERYGLESEEVFYTGPNRRVLGDPGTIRTRIAPQLRANGATEEEIAFLVRRRVELNAFASDQLVAWIEDKLAEQGVRKVIPTQATLEAAARLVLREEIAARHLVRLAERIEGEVEATGLGELRSAIVRQLEAEPAMPWDAALQMIVRRRLADAADHP